MRGRLTNGGDVSVRDDYVDAADLMVIEAHAGLPGARPVESFPCRADAQPVVQGLGTSEPSGILPSGTRTGLVPAR
jgi:hypothetical protein